jgi:hypothetical protein
MSAMEAPKISDPAVGLEPGHVDVEIHAVDTFDLQSDMIFEDSGDGAW